MSDLVRTLDALAIEAASRGHSLVDTSPHDFKPLRRWRNRGRCAACLLHEEWHPTVGWAPARPMRDTSAPIDVRP